MCVWAMTSASLWAAPLPPLWVDEEEVVEVVEPWMAWLIQCSMLMLPWLEVGVPWESPCTEPSSSEPEEVSVWWESYYAAEQRSTPQSNTANTDLPHPRTIQQLLLWTLLRLHYFSGELCFSTINVSSQTPYNKLLQKAFWGGWGIHTQTKTHSSLVSIQQSGKNVFARTHRVRPLRAALSQRCWTFMCFKVRCLWPLFGPEVVFWAVIYF